MFRCIAFLVTAGGLLLPATASADTLKGALASAYWNNPQLNAARAQSRAVDENVPLAKSGNRPIITGSVSSTLTTTQTGGIGPTTTDTRLDGAYGVTYSQNLFRGFRTRNGIREAEAGVLSSHAGLSATEQDVLFAAAQVYMDVLRDLALLDLERRNVGFLQEQLRAAEQRFEVGETTRTDVAQTRAALSVAQSDVALAEANLRASRATYRQVVVDDPDNLVPGGFPFGALMPRSLRAAINMAQENHPSIVAAVYAADAAAFEVKQIEGELLPTVSLEGSASRSFGLIGEQEDLWTNNATITGRVSIPIYQGGAVSARVRQAKEIYGQRKIEVDLTRDQVRAAVEIAWGQLDAARAAIVSSTTAVEAANIALAGVQEEQRVGQRTTLDVLIAQQQLLEARITLVLAQRDSVVAAFAVLRATGRLGAEEMDLPTPRYDPLEHYEDVKDKWHGLRTPDGR